VYYVKKGHDVDEIGTVLEDEVKGQGVFVSTFTHSLDPKKRLTIPSQWRAQVGANGLYVLPDISMKCLCVFPAAEIKQRLQKLRQHAMADRKAREFARVIGSKSDLVVWDTQGRIRIKDELLDLAGLTDQVVLVGALDRFELWAPDRLKETGGEDPASFEDAARYVGF
jgi:MraZ protein